MEPIIEANETRKYRILANTVYLKLCERSIYTRQTQTTSVKDIIRMVHVNYVPNPSRSTVLRAIEWLVETNRLAFVERKYSAYDEYIWKLI